MLSCRLIWQEKSHRPDCCVLKCMLCCPRDDGVLDVVLVERRISFYHFRAPLSWFCLFSSTEALVRLDVCLIDWFMHRVCRFLYCAVRIVHWISFLVDVERCLFFFSLVVCIHLQLTQLLPTFFFSFVYFWLFWTFWLNLSFFLFTW